MNVLLEWQKSSHPCDVVTNGDSHGSKRDALCICVCDLCVRVDACVGISSFFFFFADKNCPGNREATDQPLGQREPKLNV